MSKISAIRTFSTSNSSSQLDRYPGQQIRTDSISRLQPIPDTPVGQLPTRPIPWSTNPYRAGQISYGIATQPVRPDIQPSTTTVGQIRKIDISIVLIFE